MTEPDHLLVALGQAGYRLTTARRELTRLIASQTGHFDAAELMAQAQRLDIDIGRATVFRALEALTASGAVERIDLPNGQHAYLACEPVHHHHVVCEVCGTSQDIDDAGLRSVVKGIERRTGYRIDGHRLELFGRCPRCQRAGIA